MYLEAAYIPTLERVFQELVLPEELAHLDESKAAGAEDMVFLTSKCDQGDPDALRIMAVRLLRSGNQTELGMDTLMSLFRAGDPKATFMLGFGNIQDPEGQELGLELIGRAIDLEATPQMQYIAAICLRDGIGAAENPERSAKYLKAAADALYDPACDLYGNYLIEGYGIERDTKAGFDVIEAAALRGFVIAMNSIGVLCQKGEIYPPASGYDAYYWFEAAANASNPLAALNLGKLLMAGKLVEADPAKAADYFRKAADMGHKQALYELALCYFNGEGVQEDKKIANHWFLEAAKLAHPTALYNLAVSHLNGIGYPKDMIKAFQFASLATAQGHSIELFEALDQQMKERHKRKGLSLASLFADEHDLKSIKRA